MFAIYTSEPSGVCPCAVRQVTALSPHGFVDRSPVIQLSRIGQIALSSFFPRKGAFQFVALKSLAGLSQAAKFNILYCPSSPFTFATDVKYLRHISEP